MSIVNKLKDNADVATPPVGYKTLFIRSDNGVPALKDSDGNVTNLSIGGDASGVTFTPMDNLDWTDSNDPGNVDGALNDLASRTRAVENDLAVPQDASQTPYTPTTAADWDGGVDPGDAQEAFDQLAERVTGLEAAPDGSGDVTAAASITDNRIVRGDGGVKGVQESGVTLDDSNNVTGVAALAATTIELGHASDTTLARTGAGDISVEGNAIYRTGGTDVPVADGGTGVSTLTAYAPIFGGTTDTGAVQSGTVGTSGQVLTSNGAGALPTFQAASGGGGWTFVSTTSASASATVDISLTGGYDDYRLEAFDIMPATDSESLLCRLSQASSYLTGATDYVWHTSSESSGAASQTRSALAGDSTIYVTANFSTYQIGNVAGEGIPFMTLEINDVAQTSRKKRISGETEYVFDVGTVGYARMSGWIRANNSAVDGIRIYMSAGNITSGTFRLFGRRRS